MSFTKEQRRRGTQRSALVNTRKRMDRLRMLTPLFAQLMRSGIVDHDQLARHLNARGIPPARAICWTRQSVSKTIASMKNIGIDPTPDHGPYGTRPYSSKPLKKTAARDAN